MGCHVWRLVPGLLVNRHCRTLSLDRFNQGLHGLVRVSLENPTSMPGSDLWQREEAKLCKKILDHAILGGGDILTDHPFQLQSSSVLEDRIHQILLDTSSHYAAAHQPIANGQFVLAHFQNHN